MNAGALTLVDHVHAKTHAGAVDDEYTELTMTRRSHKNGLAILAATSAALAIVESRPAQAGCTKDVECKGERICENGRCVYPPPAVETESPAPPAVPVATPDAASPVASSLSIAAPPSPAPLSPAKPTQAST
jgi:hypothetical protein